MNWNSGLVNIVLSRQTGFEREHPFNKPMIKNKPTVEHAQQRSYSIHSSLSGERQIWVSKGKAILAEQKHNKEDGKQGRKKHKGYEITRH